jgi:subtilase family serine protease
MRLPNRKLSFVAIFAFFLPFAAAISAQTSGVRPQPRITQAVDETSRVTLKGTVHPLANAANDAGAAPDGMQLERMHLVLKRSPAQEAALQQLISGLHASGSASYHKWLTPEQFDQQFGPADQDVATVKLWLTSHGFQVSTVEPSKQEIEFSGSVAQMRGAFHTQIHKYMVNGETHFANVNDPQIPAALAPVVGGFASLNNFRARRLTQFLGKATYDPATHKATPQWTYPVPGGVNYVVAPSDFAVQYDLNPLYTAGTTGAGQTIAIINDSNINVLLANQFRSIFGLSANPPQVIIDGNDPGIDGINNPYGLNFDSFEAYIDVEWSGAVAPAATVDLVIAADTALEPGLILAAEHAVFGNIAPVVSLSFGNCEANLGSANNAFLNQLWEQAAAQGQTVLVASGDSGSAGCDDPNQAHFAIDGLGVSGFASTPFNVAVGGTDFFYSDFNSSQATLNAQLATFWGPPTPTNSPATSLLIPIPEQPWNNSQYGLNILNFFNINGFTTIVGGGGGASIVYAKPPWQTGTGVPADGARDIPDVSLFAANGANLSFYPSCASDGDCQPGGTPVQISGAGGTSFASPEFAGIMALVNQKYGRQGQANFVLYPLKANFPAAFHDVVQGTNTVPCEFSPTKGTNCISAGAGAIIFDGITEGQLGTGSTADFNAAAGYNLATGLGTIDANLLVTDWNKIIFTGTSTTLTPSKTSFTHGTSITVSGTVTGTTPTGDVALMTDSTEPVNQGQAFFTLSGGVYSGNVAFLPGGTYNIWGQYGGDTKNALSTSTKTSITVSPEASSTNFSVANATGNIAITSGASNVPYGTQLILAAEPFPTACPSASSSCAAADTSPTGTVTFSDNGAAINTAVVNAEGDAEYNSAFAVGSHSVTAAYSGDNSYNSSVASAITFSIAKDTPAIFLSASNVNIGGQVITGQATVFNIQIENNTANLVGFSVPAAAPTGTVTVSGFPGGVPTSATLSAAVDPNSGFPDGVGTITAPPSTPAGTYHVTINYSGDSNYNATSANGSLTIVSSSGLTSTTAASASAASTSPTAAITVTGTVTGQSGHPAPTGFIIIFSSGADINEIPIVPGAGDSSTFSTTLNSEFLFQGANFVTLQYTGDATYNPSAATLNSGGAVSNPLSDFSIVPQTTIVPVAPGGLVSDTVNVNSVNGFGGTAGSTVSFTCTAAAGITCSAPSSVTVVSGSSGALTLNISASSPLASGNYSILLTGTFGSFVHTLAIQAAVSPNAALNLNLTATPPNPTPIVITTPGQTGSSVVTATAEGGLTGTVNFSVILSPNNLFEPPVCSFNSPSVALSGGKAASTLMCTSTAVVAQIVPPANRPQGPSRFIAGGVLTASVALCLLLLYMPDRRRALALFVAVAFIVIAFGCGGGTSTTPPPPNAGTTPGTYYATVFASVTNGGVTVTQSTTIPVTVQ